LKVEEDQVHPPQELDGWRQSGTVEARDGEPRRLVPSVFHPASVGDHCEKAVLRGEEVIERNSHFQES
jgi:hypothetical protein